MKTVGLIVNPVAGMGGSVGLKGTDGDMYQKAVEMGAEPVSPMRALEFLTHVRKIQNVNLLAAPGAMGADHAERAGVKCDVIGEPGTNTTSDDTRGIARKMIDAGADIIAFAGGDGTARDMADAVGLDVPVIAIPSGVKVYSSVFAFSPRIAGELLDAFLDGADVDEHEVLDIDEDAFRHGRVDSRHYGYLLVPEVASMLQAGKESSVGGNSAEAKELIAESVVEDMEAGVLYLLGSGTTIRAIADQLDLEKTLLGVDAVVDGQLRASDANEAAILDLLDDYERAIIVITPLGGNGFIFGRGNKQFTPDVLRRVGRENILLIGNREKLLKLPCLHVDTGDPALDAELSGYMDVMVAPGHKKMMKVA